MKDILGSTVVTKDSLWNARNALFEHSEALMKRLDKKEVNKVLREKLFHDQFEDTRESLIL